MSDMLGVTIEGLDKLRMTMEAHAKKVHAKQLEALVKGAVMIQSTAVKSIQNGPKTGRMYGDHQASKSPEAPATDTGNLARNIGIEYDKDRLAADIVSRAEYSMALEFGTNDGKIKERPFMMPAFETNLPLIEEMFKVAANG